MANPNQTEVIENVSCPNCRQVVFKRVTLEIQPPVGHNFPVTEITGSELYPDAPPCSSPNGHRVDLLSLK